VNAPSTSDTSGSSAGSASGSIPTALRVGVAGLGQRGTLYAHELAAGSVPGARLAAVCDPDPQASTAFSSVQSFATAAELAASGAVDALVIATPPTEHLELTLKALDAGLHLLVEKPLSPRKADCERILRKHARLGPGAPVLATALPLRADPRFARLRELVTSGTLGELKRVAWTVTDCFRSAAYYDERPWRGELRGEGGGLLQNQCLHQLDLWQWLFGLPRTVRAFCEFGRHHAIEVEDEVSAHLEYDSGLRGVFFASSGEAAGTNRLEVVGTRARAVVEGEALELTRFAVSTPEAVRTAAVRARGPLFTSEREHIEPARVGPRELLANFVAAATSGAPLIAPGSEALAAIELANALLVSGLDECSVELPLDGRAFGAALKRQQIRSEKNAVAAEPGR
jgi:predicted dehydrogenase